MAHLNDKYGSSTDLLNRRRSSITSMDIELQNTQPRRRQKVNHYVENDSNKDENPTRSHSIPPKQDEFYPQKSDELLPINNSIEIPRNISVISSSEPVVSSIPATAKEK